MKCVAMCGAMCGALCGLGAMGAGCASRELATPKTRVGALPFPGPWSLYAAADPSAVTPHRYASGLDVLLSSEGDRGIIYTTRAGFIDMAHLREAMDWTWYLKRRIDEAKEIDGVREVVFEHECVRGTLRVPMGLSSEDHARVAAMAAYRLLTWHEISTWYGYSLVAFVSEERSTFTVDDTTSHVLGVELGVELATRAKDQAEYEALADAGLLELMETLDAQNATETTRACERVRGTWWKGSRAVLFDAHVALADGRKRPLLAHGAGEETAEGAAYEWGDALGVRWNVGALAKDWWTLDVTGAAARRVERVLGTRRVCGDRDLEMLIQDVAQQMAARPGVRVVVDQDAQAAAYAGTRD